VPHPSRIPRTAEYLRLVASAPTQKSSAKGSPVSPEDRLPGGDEMAEMHRILRKVLEREPLTTVEVEFLHVLRIDALEHFVDSR
jgi:hypothetical protein